MTDWREKYKRFREWQQQPYQVKPLSEENHVCPTCGTTFEGNYCPRCGQSARIGRYSFKNAFLLFLDVWGLGNRGMFRTIRDLILRPGYMIRDYLQGMQMAYFPPFKLLFLIIALSLLVQTGLNIKGVNRIDESMEVFDKVRTISPEQDNIKNADVRQKQMEYYTTSKAIITWTYKHMTIVTLVFLLFFTGPLYLFFRHSPNIPDMRFSEFFVSVIYFTNMTSIYSIIWDFFCGNIYFETFLLLLAIIPLKQLSGYGYWHTIWRTLLAFILFWIIIFFVGGIFGGIYSIIYMIR